MEAVNMRQVPVTRTRHRLMPDPKRVIAKPYLPGEEAVAGRSRVARVMERILNIPEELVPGMVERVLAEFSGRHRDFRRALEYSLGHVTRHIPPGARISPERRTLIGAYFTHEYAIEAAALFNPSIVAAPDQSGLADGELRFILSLRGAGEGHISSIEFRTGVIDARGEITLQPPSPYASTARREHPQYDKDLFAHKLAELEADNEVSALVLDPLPDPFNREQLDESLAALDSRGGSRTLAFETTKIINWLASSNYLAHFDPASDISERILFPFGPTESGGMEDARFVRFTGGDGAVTYYASYTAFDGFEILPQLVETRDFVSFRIATLNGRASQNKGMALFPRKLGGRFVTLSRNDSENLFIMSSDNPRFWERADPLQTPMRPWELVQIGNCGSPIETEAGWLVLTHGVGPMRRYSIGAMLLDLENPRRVIAHLPNPLMVPDEHEREGYVPNVLYSCGGLVHNGRLILPYGFSDYGVGIATLAMDDLIALLLEHRTNS